MDKQSGPMTGSDLPRNNNDCHTVYSAIVNYHNNLVNMRFTVAGLYLAGSAFLANVLFSGGQLFIVKIAVAILGLFITFIFWVMEIRTYNLLQNLGKRGDDIEKTFNLYGIGGFFDLMERQPISPNVPFKNNNILWKMINHDRFVKFFTHSKGLNLLYFITGLFWSVMLVLVSCNWK